MRCVAPGVEQTAGTHRRGAEMATSWCREWRRSSEVRLLHLARGAGAWCDDLSGGARRQEKPAARGGRGRRATSHLRKGTMTSPSQRGAAHSSTGV
jgi:hypothetical protein